MLTDRDYSKQASLLVGDAVIWQELVKQITFPYTASLVIIRQSTYQGDVSFSSAPDQRTQVPVCQPST